MWPYGCSVRASGVPMSSGPEDTESTDADFGQFRVASIECEECGGWVEFDLRGPADCPEHGDGREPPMG